MKLVEMLVDTAYKGPRKTGELVSVPDDFADRWVKNGIATLADSKGTPIKTDDEVSGDANSKNNEDQAPVEDATTEDVSNMSAKELYALCVKKGIEVEAKKSREYYLEKLA